MMGGAILEAEVGCSRCGSGLAPPPGAAASAAALRCPSCRATLQVGVFPALFRNQVTQWGEALRREDEASCFYHPDKRAEVVCSMCGRFICSLCDIPMASERLCPVCFERAKRCGRMPGLVGNRVLYDCIALSLAVLPLLVFPFTVITAPLAIFISIFHWKSPSSLLPRTKIRFLAAILIAGLQVAGWTAVLVFSLL